MAKLIKGKYTKTAGDVSRTPVRNGTPRWLDKKGALRNKHGNLAHEGPFIKRGNEYVYQPGPDEWVFLPDEVEPKVYYILVRDEDVPAQLYSGGGGGGPLTFNNKREANEKAAELLAQWKRNYPKISYTVIREVQKHD